MGGSAHMLFTLVALSAVDCARRRPLMLWGAAGLAVNYSAMELCQAKVVQVLPVLLLLLVLLAINPNPQITQTAKRWSISAAASVACEGSKTLR